MVFPFMFLTFPTVCEIVQLASVKIELCDKYDCPQFVKIIKNRLLWIVSNELSADPWDFFEPACRLEWEPLAKEALKNFGKALKPAFETTSPSERKKLPSYFWTQHDDQARSERVWWLYSSFHLGASAMPGKCIW